MNDKDQAAIDHVASVSKHPHAAMIVKQLITGWDLRNKRTGTITNLDNCWCDEYELIEPKPAKPAYRVYRDKNNGSTYTRDAIDCPRDDHIPSSNYEWLSDWIEYDPPKKWPTPLVERIAAIDIKAAEWIVEHWDDLLDSKYVTEDNYSRDSKILLSMFCWKASPQGVRYWNNIDNKLR